MVLRLSLPEMVALCLAALLSGGLAVRWFARWRYARALDAARRIAARLRVPATTLGAVEDQAAAVEELCQFREAAAAIAAARELLAVPEPAVRSAAVEVLRRIRALELWTRDLQNGSYRAKLAAIEALAEVGDERAMEALLQALGDDDPDVARAASQAMVARDPDFAADLLAKALSSPNRRLAETAAATLVRMGENAAEALVSQLSSLSAQARRLAVESLAAIGNPAHAAALLPLLDVDPSPAVRAAVAEALARLNCVEALPRLRQVALSDPDWFVRARAAFALAEVGCPEARDFLLSLLSAVQAQLAPALGEGEEVEVVTDGLPRVRAAAIAGLRLLGVSEEEIAAATRPPSAAVSQEEPAGGSADPPREDWVAGALALRERDPAARANAARQLGEAGRAAIPYLQAALADPDPLVRAEAARGLGRVGDSSCLSALAARLRDPDADVRLAASNAMRGIVIREASPQLSLDGPDSGAEDPA